MPVYEFECENCNHEFVKNLSIKNRDLMQVCENCKSEKTKRVISAVGFVLKGDSWPGKNIKIKNQMARKNERLKKKEYERKMDAPKMTLAPNVDGERVDSWSDAKKLASEKGKATSTYDNMIRKEKS